MIAQVKAKDLGGYTDESVRAVRDALAAAEKVAADPDATQVASLNAAVDGLSATGAGIVPIAAAALTLMAGAALALAKR